MPVKRSIFRGQPRLRWVEPKAARRRRARASLDRNLPEMARGVVLGLLACPVVLGLAIAVEPKVIAELRSMAHQIPLAMLTLVVPFMLILVMSHGTDLVTDRTADIRAGRLIVANVALAVGRVEGVIVRLDRDFGPWLGVIARAPRPSRRTISVDVVVDPAITVEELTATIAACVGVPPVVVSRQEDVQAALPAMRWTPI